MPYTGLLASLVQFNGMYCRYFYVLLDEKLQLL